MRVTAARTGAAALVVLAGLTAMTACGGVGSSAGPSTITPTVPTTTATTTATTTTASSGDPLQLRVVVATDDSPAPDSSALQAFGNLDCDATSTASPSVASTGTPGTGEVAVCDADGTKYLLGPALAVGGVASATAEQPPGSASWAVHVTLDDDTAAALAAASRGAGAAQEQVALLLDDEVVSAVGLQSATAGGGLEITGTFDQDDAETLAAALRAGG